MHKTKYEESEGVEGGRKGGREGGRDGGRRAFLIHVSYTEHRMATHYYLPYMYSMSCV